MQTPTAPILVLGATGKIGRRVAERLAARNVPTRIGSRSAVPAFDWTDRSTWEPALRGARAAFVSYFPDLALPGSAEAVEAFAKLAQRSGVRRLVLISGRGEPGAQRAEERLRATPGIDWTIVRASWFNQNFSESFFAEGIVAGELFVPDGGTPEPFVDVDDIADIVTAALTEDGHAGQLYEVTGPRLLTFADAVAEIARATGREIAYVPVTIDEYRAALEQHPEATPEIVELVALLFTEVLDGRNASLTDGVQRALGRPPKDFAAFAHDAVAAGAWSAPSPT